MLARYLYQVLRHKYFVFIEACHLKIPWLGLIHDASKLRLRELLPYARYFYGNYPSLADYPNICCRCPSYTGRALECVEREFNVAWNEHQKKNRHHWQFYLLVNDSSEPQIQALPIPERYIREMIADWRGAGRAYGNPNTLDWYYQSKGKQIMHPATRRRVEELLNITVATKGI